MTVSQYYSSTHECRVRSVMASKEYLQSKFGEWKSKRKGVLLNCAKCGREFYVHQCRAKRGQVKFCSVICHRSEGILPKAKPILPGEGLSVPDRVRLRWAEIIGVKKRQSLILQRSACERCSFADTRVLVIHHKDRNPKNNHVSNLEVLCPNCHAIEHYEARDGMYRSLRDRCANGHPFSEENRRPHLIRGRVQTSCIECTKERIAKRREVKSIL